MSAFDRRSLKYSNLDSFVRSVSEKKERPSEEGALPSGDRKNISGLNLSTSFEKNKEDFFKVLEEEEDNSEKSPTKNPFVRASMGEGDSFKKPYMNPDMVESRELNMDILEKLKNKNLSGI